MIVRRPQQALPLFRIIGRFSILIYLEKVRHLCKHHSNSHQGKDTIPPIVFYIFIHCSLHHCIIISDQSYYVGLKRVATMLFTVSSVSPTGGVVAKITYY